MAGACYFIWQKVVNNEQLDFEHFRDQLETRLFSDYKILVVLFGLSLTNWFLEAFKWKTLVASVQQITFYNALQQSLGSLTASLFTPNRIGEYGAKAVYYKKGIRRKIMLLNLLSNMMQMTITLIFGSIGFLYFIYHFKVNLDMYRLRRVAYIIAILIVIIFAGYKGVKKIRGFYLDKIINFIKQMPVKNHILNMFYSLVRYLVFSHQFLFLLRIFGVETDYVTLMALITSMYFLASIVPGLALLDWLIKGSAAIWLFEFIGIRSLTVVTIVLIMWILNFGIPALIGSYFVINFRIPANT